MQCPSCGALQEAGVEQCLVCEVTLKTSEPSDESLDPVDCQTVASESAQPHQSQSKLIEFPGVLRSTVPQANEFEKFKKSGLARQLSKLSTTEASTLVNLPSHLR
jgi:hypothetical protein